MSSSVPAAITALLAISKAALGTNATVWFGKQLSQYQMPITLQITGVTDGSQVAKTLGPDYKRDETYDIVCVLTSFAGDLQYMTRMTEVFANFSLLTVAIGNNPTLNQSVRFSEIHSFTYVPGADAKGMTLGQLTFMVACQARITSLT
jgi:hypothetical protein